MRVCEVCGKGSVIQKSGAHQYGGGWAMRAQKKRFVWMVNLHAVRIVQNGVHKTMRLCTKCLRRVKGEMNSINKKEVSDIPKIDESIAASA